jgi:hypothetical protein
LDNISFGYNKDGLYTLGLRWNIMNDVVMKYTKDSNKVDSNVTKVKSPWSLGMEFGYGTNSPKDLVVQDPANPVTNLSFNGSRKTSENNFYFGPEVIYDLNNVLSVSGGVGALVDIKSQDFEEYFINITDPQRNKLGLNNDKTSSTKIKTNYGVGPEVRLGRLNVGLRFNNFTKKDYSIGAKIGYRLSK